MNYIYTKISLDVQNIASQLTVSAKRGDTSRGLIISLTDNGKVFNIPDRCYATFSARKSDGTFVDNGCTIKDNCIIYEFSEQLTLEPGRVDCDITLYDSSSQRLVSPLFTIYVYETIKSEYTSDVVSSDEFTMLTKLISDATEAIVNTNKATAEANVAAEEARTTADEVIGLANNAIDAANEANKIARNHLYSIEATPDGKLKLLDAKNNVISIVDTFHGDDDTLHRYLDGMLSVIGIKERNNDQTFRMWVGTNDEYMGLKDKDPSMFYWITDDDTYDTFVEQINNIIDNHNKLVDDISEKTEAIDEEFSIIKNGYIDMDRDELLLALEGMSSGCTGNSISGKMTKGTLEQARAIATLLNTLENAILNGEGYPSLYIRYSHSLRVIDGGHTHSFGDSVSIADYFGGEFKNICAVIPVSYSYRHGTVEDTVHGNTASVLRALRVIFTCHDKSGDRGEGVLTEWSIEWEKPTVATYEYELRRNKSSATYGTIVAAGG